MFSLSITNFLGAGAATCAGRFAINSTKNFLPVVTLSAQDNAALLQQLKCCFKYQSDSKTFAEN